MQQRQSATLEVNFDKQGKKIESTCDYKPSETNKDQIPWLNAMNNRFSYSFKKVGKWEMHYSSDQIDKVWEIVQAEVMDGAIWMAKVSPLNGKFPNDHVLLVYVPDYENEDEIIKIYSIFKEKGLITQDKSKVGFGRECDTGKKMPPLYTAEEIEQKLANAFRSPITPFFSLFSFSPDKFFSKRHSQKKITITPPHTFEHRKDITQMNMIDPANLRSALKLNIEALHESLTSETDEKTIQEKNEIDNLAAYLDKLKTKLSNEIVIDKPKLLSRFIKLQDKLKHVYDELLKIKKTIPQVDESKLTFINNAISAIFKCWTDNDSLSKPSLPEEVLMHVFSFLPANNLPNLTRVSSLWHSAAEKYKDQIKHTDEYVSFEEDKIVKFLHDLIDDKESFQKNLEEINKYSILRGKKPVDIDQIIYQSWQNFFKTYKDFFSRFGMQRGQDKQSQAWLFIERSLDNMKDALANKKNLDFQSNANTLLKYVFNIVAQEKGTEVEKVKEKMLVIAKLMHNANINIEYESVRNALVESSSSIEFRK